MEFDVNKVVTTTCEASGREIFYQTASGAADDSDFRYLEPEEIEAFKAYRAANPDKSFTTLTLPGH